MNSDLEALFEKIASVIPTLDPNNDKFLFSAQTLPVPPTHLTTSKIVIKKTYHDHTIAFENDLCSTIRQDALWIQASKITCRNLALLILAGLFHPSPTDIQVNLVHSATQIKNLIILTNYINIEKLWNYATQPLAYGYTPSETAKHPWYKGVKSPDELPVFYLSNSDGRVTYTEKDWRDRDTVIGFGNDRASVKFAELLLNASLPENPVVEYQLEGEEGVRGVGINSTEVQIFLPGSLGWDGSLEE